MTRSCLLALLMACAAPGTLFAQASLATVQGTVADAQGAPMPGANVQIAGTTDGAATDAQGRFQFSTTKTGRQTLRTTMIGYAATTRSVTLAPGDTATVRFVLRKALIKMDEAVVAARAYTTGNAENVTLSPLEAVTTPGANGDLFRALQTFPGVTTVADGAGLFVRGGDKSETTVLLDQATVAHPYKYESPTGGFFGTIPPFLVSGTHFSAGGFSAKYGNALSAVLAMKSQDMPPQSSVQANVGLAAASVGANVRMADDWGARFSGNRSFTGLLFRVNGQQDNFTVVPQGYDANLSLMHHYSETGRLKFFNYLNTHRLGVHVREPSFDGIYRTRATSTLHNLQLKDRFQEWSVKASASVSRYASRRQLGSLDLHPADWTYKLRVDGERSLGPRLRLSAGAEAERTASTFRGVVPANEDVLDPEGITQSVDERHATMRWGGYGEVSYQPTRRIIANAGLRTDYHTRARQAILDPRLSLQYVLTEHTQARLAWGRYHQFPAPEKYGSQQGNPHLDAQVADHWVAGLLTKRDLLTLRAEAYYKPYRRLVLRHAANNYANAGDGFARGLDLFAKYGAFLRTRFSGRLAYSFLQSRRTQVRRQGRELTYERGPAPFDVTHSLTLVGKARLIGFLSAGLTAQLTTGRPITPVTGAVPAQDGAYYLPVDGPVGAERLPAFRRLDAQLSYFLPLGDGHNAVLYLAVNNLLDRANVLGHRYSADYTERTARTTNFRRSVYVGVNVTLK